MQVGALVGGRGAAGGPVQMELRLDRAGLPGAAPYHRVSLMGALGKQVLVEVEGPRDPTVDRRVAARLGELLRPPLLHLDVGDVGRRVVGQPQTRGLVQRRVARDQVRVGERRRLRLLGRRQLVGRDTRRGRLVGLIGRRGGDLALGLARDGRVGDRRPPPSSMVCRRTRCAECARVCLRNRRRERGPGRIRQAFPIGLRLVRTRRRLRDCTARVLLEAEP